ncbi:MAG: hypothetical protein V3T80_01075 [Kiloniellales bacterium]
MLQQLEESQWWTPDMLRAHQYGQLTILLRHAMASVPYYAERLRAAGVPAREPLTPEIWQGIPLLRREDIQEAGTALHSKAVPKGHQPLNRNSTSGSTGKPVEIIWSRIAQLFWDVFTLRDHRWHRRDLHRKLAVIRSFPDGKALYPKGARSRTWAPIAGSIYATGPSVGLAITTSTEHQAEWLRRQRPEYLLTFPSALGDLVLHCRDNNISFPGLREVRTISEAIDSELRLACREILGVPLTDIYSTQESGYLALQCPDHEHYHVQGEGVFLEVLDEEERACGPGETGRIVITPLHNFAMPLIRYDIGDYAELGGPCPCGRGLPVLKGILGRVRNMVTLPNGERYWPSLYGGLFRKIAPIRQYQVVQKSLNHLDVGLVMDRELTDQEKDELRDLIHTRIRYPFDLTFSYHDEIPRGPGGKYEDFKSEVTPA